MDLVAAVRESGVVGAGGAGFPTHIKLAAKPRFLIVNGAECEPLLRVDQELLANEEETLLKALAGLSAHLAPETVYLAVKGKHTRIVNRWRALLEPLGARLFVLEDFYPAGDEQVLVYETTGLVVPPGGIPLDVGALVLNVETLFNIGRALEGHPVTVKHVTVTGAVARPQTMRVPVGTSYSFVLEAAAGVTIEEAVFLDGGPMMGRPVTDLAQPVTKTTKGLIVLPAGLRVATAQTGAWPGVSRLSRNLCEVCRMCTDLCPRYLLGHPLEIHKIMLRHALTGVLPPRDFPAALLCVECGVCEHVACPVGIFPRRVAARQKTSLQAAGVRYPASGPVTPREERVGRRVPSSRLIGKLGLKEYDRPCPLREEKLDPPEVRVPLAPPIGQKCLPLVREGQPVREGDPVGAPPDGAVGARVHASINGWVVRVTNDHVIIRAQGVKNRS